MAEEEKIEAHAKKALRILTNRKKKWKDKIKDFLWEILIIIVGVSITLWFHNWSDRRQDRVLEKNFLIGIRSDLNTVKHTLDSNFVYYQPTLDYYDSAWKQMNEHRINKAYIDTNSWNLVNDLYFSYDNSRFESFKSSGYLRFIENDSLSNDITRLYTVYMPSQVEFDEQAFNERRQQFITYIGSIVRIDSSGHMYVSDILNNPSVRFQIEWQRGFLGVRKHQKEMLLQEIERVIKEIDQELKNRFNYNVENKK